MSYHYNRHRRQQDHGVDDWLMTYADMITLLLCFFAIFLSVSVPKKEQFDQARSKVLEQFAKPVAAGKAQPMPSIPAFSGNDMFHAMPSIIDQYKGLKNVQIKQGDRITTIDMNSAPLFPRGAAQLSDEGSGTLARILNIINSEQYHDYRVTVEGHTDDSPINTPQFPSNWELSTARASAVVRFFIGNGVKAERLRAAGYADIFPKVPNRDAAGRPIPDNQAQNRRVVIKMEKIDPQTDDNVP